MKFKSLIGEIISIHDKNWFNEISTEFRKNSKYNSTSDRIKIISFEGLEPSLADEILLVHPEIAKKYMDEQDLLLISYCWDNPFYNSSSSLPTLKASFDKLYNEIKSFLPINKTYYYSRKIAKEVDDQILKIIYTEDPDCNDGSGKYFIHFSFLYRLNYQIKFRELFFIKKPNKKKKKYIRKSSRRKFGSVTICYLFMLLDDKLSPIVKNGKSEIEEISEIVYNFFQSQDYAAKQPVNIEGDKYAISYIISKLCLNAQVSTGRLEKSQIIKINGDFVKADLIRQHASRYSNKKNNDAVIKRISQFLPFKSPK